MLINKTNISGQKPIVSNPKGTIVGAKVNEIFPFNSSHKMNSAVITAASDHVYID